MENGHPAFLAGEYVRIAPHTVLEEIQEQFARENDWTLNPYPLFSPNMMDYADHRLQIIAVSFYHLGIVLYELREIGSDSPVPGQWLENALIDQELDRVNEGPLFQVANQVYRIIKNDETIEIQDYLGTTYCSLRKNNLNTAFHDISRVASIRCAISFSGRYNFDGIECREPTGRNAG